MTKIYAYDDVPKNIAALEKVELDENSEFSLEVRLVKHEDHWTNAANEIQSLQGNFALLFDLGFRYAGSPTWECIKNQTELFSKFGITLSDSFDIEFTYDSQKITLPNDVIDGIALLLIALTNNNPGNTFIYIATGRGATGRIGDFIEYILSNGNNNTERKTIIKQAGRNVEDIRSATIIIDNIIREWYVAFPQYHKDIYIDNCVNAWLKHFRKLKLDHQDERFCQHDNIEQNDSDYDLLVREMFSLGVDSIGDNNGIKAMLRLDKVPSSALASEDWFYKWDVANPYPDYKKIGNVCLKSVLESIFNMEVEVLSSNIQLPSYPALPFLISLRVLSQGLMTKESGKELIEKTGKVVIAGVDGNYCLTIPLKQANGKEFGIAKRWAKKVAAGGTTLTSDGICGALWNTTMGKVNDLSIEAAQDDVEKALLNIFDGVGRPIVGVVFAPNFIHLYWG